MPGGDGTGPSWGGGPGSGRGKGRGFRGGQRTGNNEGRDSERPTVVGANKSENLIAIIGSAIALATSVVRLISSRKGTKKNDS